MGQLLELPDEILGGIVLENLLANPVLDQSPTSIAWAESIRYAAKLAIWQNYTLYRLILTCRRFYNLLQDLLCRQMNNIRSPDQLTKFVQTFTSSPTLENPTATTFCVSMSEVAPLFWLPSITSVRVIKPMIWGVSELPNQVGHTTSTSQIVNISLIDRGFDDKSLAELFRWPQFLKSLAYEVNQDGYALHYAGLPPREFTCTSFVKTLYPVRSSLENLTLTRTKITTGWGYSFPIYSGICLRRFTNLKTLSTLHVFLISFALYGDDLHRRLPRSLENLQVYYDDLKYAKFLDITAGSGWLVSLLQQKWARLPNLRSVSITTPEMPFVEDEDLRGSFPFESTAAEAQAVEDWTLPADLKLEAGRASIALNITLGYRKPRYSDDALAL